MTSDRRLAGGKVIGSNIKNLLLLSRRVRLDCDHSGK